MNHAFTVEPGAEFPVMAGGDFVFCNFAAHDIRVIIQDSPRVMRAGSKWRPAGGFVAGDLIVKNPDPVNPVAVVLTIGTGDFDDQIIRGEVTVNPGIRGRDGVFIDDTRSTVRLSAAFGNITPREYVEGGEIFGADTSAQSCVPTALDDGRVLTCDTDGENWRVFRWPSTEWEPLPRLGHGTGAQVGAELWVPEGQDLPGVGKRIVIRVYDAATLKHREDRTTEVQWGGTSGNPRVFGFAELPGNRYAVALTNGGATPSGRGIGVFQPDGSLVRNLDGAGRALIVRNGVLHLIDDYLRPANIALFDAETLAPLSESNNQLPETNDFVYGACMTVRDTLLLNGGGLAQVREMAVTNVTISASGTVSACAGSGRFKAGQVDTIAQLYTQRLENGRVLASGQLLRAVLEIYAGRYMPDDYLDYIYAVKADNLNGISPRVIDAGGQSFAAAGIADDAAGTFPQTIEITLREGLL